MWYRSREGTQAAREHQAYSINVSEKQLASPVVMPCRACQEVGFQELDSIFIGEVSTWYPS